MKLVIQRVNKAKVSVAGEIVGQIEKGLFILVGVGVGDNEEMARSLATKVAKLRVTSDENDKMNLSVKDVGASILAVSQFTLYADTSAGNRPSFVKSEKPDIAHKLYKLFIECLRSEGINVQTGKFGEYMNIDCQLDGPVTIVIEA